VCRGSADDHAGKAGGLLMNIHLWLLLGFLFAVVVVCGTWKSIKWLAVSVAVVALPPLGLLMLVVR